MREWLDNIFGCDCPDEAEARRKIAALEAEREALRAQALRLGSEFGAMGARAEMAEGALAQIAAMRLAHDDRVNRTTLTVALFVANGVGRKGMGNG
jgi:hypothetical protein